MSKKNRFLKNTALFKYIEKENNVSTYKKIHIVFGYIKNFPLHI